MLPTRINAEPKIKAEPRINAEPGRPARGREPARSPTSVMIATAAASYWKLWGLAIFALVGWGTTHCALESSGETGPVARVRSELVRSEMEAFLNSGFEARGQELGRADHVVDPSIASDRIRGALAVLPSGRLTAAAERPCSEATDQLGSLRRQVALRPVWDTGQAREWLRAVADQWAHGSPQAVDWSGILDLKVATGHPKFWRGQKETVSLEARTTWLGRASGLARLQVRKSGETRLILDQVGRGDRAWVTSMVGRERESQYDTEPTWMRAEGPSSVSGHGSVVNMLRWLPHHFDLEVLEQAGWPGEIIQQQLGSGAGSPTIAGEGELPVGDQAIIVGWVKASVARSRGVSCDEATGPLAKSPIGRWVWTRQVPTPEPHAIWMRWDGRDPRVARLLEVRFLRVHPLRDEMETLAHLDVLGWREAPELGESDFELQSKDE